MDTVALHPDPLHGDERVEWLPPYVRPGVSSGRAGRGLYWHRPRSASIYHYPPSIYTRRSRQHPRLCVHFWCGSSRQILLPKNKVKEAIRFHFSDERPEEMLCGTCDGRAEAYYRPEDELVFRPVNHFDPPPWCPADVWPTGPDRLCPLCSTRVNARKGWAAHGIARHRPTEMTTDPCPGHGWKWIGAHDWGIKCLVHRCEWAARYGWKLSRK